MAPQETSSHTGATSAIKWSGLPPRTHQKSSALVVQGSSFVRLELIDQYWLLISLLLILHQKLAYLKHYLSCLTHQSEDSIIVSMNLNLNLLVGPGFVDGIDLTFLILKFVLEGVEICR